MKLCDMAARSPCGREADAMTRDGNVDGRELQKFERMANQWWDRTGPLKPLHDINPLRLRYVRFCRHLAGARVLDVGCGGGILSEAMAGAGARVTGIDMGEAPLAAARDHLAESGLHVDYRRISVEEFSRVASESFDLITCMELLEHVPSPPSVIAACARLLVPGGSLVTATLNRNLKSFLFAIIGAEWVLRLLDKGTHDFRKFIKPAELDAWGTSAGLAVKGATGMGYNPFSGRYFLTRDMSVNYMMHFTRHL